MVQWLALRTLTSVIANSNQSGAFFLLLHPPSRLPLLSQPVTAPGLKMHAHTSANGVFDDPNKSTFSILHFDTNYLTCSCARGGGGGGGGREEGLNDSDLGTCIGRFQSNGSAGMSLKGLNAKFSDCNTKGIHYIHCFFCVC